MRGYCGRNLCKTYRPMFFVPPKIQKMPNYTNEPSNSYNKSEKSPTLKETRPKDDVPCKFPAVTWPSGKGSWQDSPSFFLELNNPNHFIRWSAPPDTSVSQMSSPDDTGWSAKLNSPDESPPNVLVKTSILESKGVSWRPVTGKNWEKRNWSAFVASKYWSIWSLVFCTFSFLDEVGDFYSQEWPRQILVKIFPTLAKLQKIVSFLA